MSVFEVLDALEEASGSNAKISILSEHRNNPQLVFLLDAALNFKRKFFVKKFNVGTPCGFDADVTFKTFREMLQILQDRVVTGNAAVGTVEEFFKRCSTQEQKWYSRVLLKDLRCGFGISSCVKAGIDIPEFEVMLAKDHKNTKNLEAIVRNGMFVTPKLDGYRCLAVCSRGNVSLYSRSGTEYENFPSIVESLLPLCQDSSFVLDGEIMSDDFNAMQQTAFANKRGTTVGDVSYQVFGMIPYDEWQSGVFKMLTKHRLDNLDILLDGKQNANIQKVDYKLVFKVEDILTLEQEFLSKGYEGAMALPNIPYFLGKKSNKLMKFKTMQSQDCKVVGMYEGSGKYEGVMGGLNVVQENGVRCDVGSGFRDEDREYMWSHKAEILGRIVEIKFQELSKDGVMRFPIFLRFRDISAGTGKI